MNKTATSLSQGSLKDLYRQRNPPKNHLTLQVLAFQASENNPKEIILRISDKEAFLDCLLVGSYTISRSAIVSTEYTHSSQTIKPLDIIKVVDYFCKIDTSKICHLRIIIRKIEEVGSSNYILGRPQEISQMLDNSYTPIQQINPNHQLINVGTQDTPIKIEEGSDPPNYGTENDSNGAVRAISNGGNQIQKTAPKEQESLTLQQIMNNKQGFFIGRLVRYKFGSKEAKDGPMSFLYLGFLDVNGDVVRVHLAGRIAIRESRQLKRGRVYYIKGLQLFQGDKIKGGPQIRLRQKDYRIQQIQNQIIKSQYKDKYYRWEHENEWVESEMVDVVGIVEDIEEKITYKNANTFQEQRDVVRLIIRNAFKTVKISFWADHINLLNSYNLTKKQPILIEDIKKKKTVFLDFMAESNIIVLDPDCEQWEEIQQYLPPAQEAPEPTNVKQLLQVYDLQPFNSKIRSLNLSVSNINWKWVIYKMCNDCKKKVEKILQQCPDCHKGNFTYKYNCSVEMSDPTGTITCVAFDPICQKLFGRSANQFCRLKQQEMKELVQSLVGLQFRSSIQHKNNRLILRALERDNSEMVGQQNNGEAITKYETKIRDQEESERKE